MPSLLQSDPRATGGTGGEVADLLVLWQHPADRRIWPIGRLLNHGDDFQFRYTAGALAIPGFRPLPGLPDLHRSYRSREIPLVFGQRTLARTRPDYPAYVQALGLEPDTATPWEQIVHSGGHREGDTLQFMRVPEVRGGHAQATFLASGVRHVANEPRSFLGSTRHVSQDEQERALRSLVPGDTLAVTQEEGNPQDPSACLLLRETTPVAWIPRFLSEAFRELLDAGNVSVEVNRLGDPGGAPHLRLTAVLDSAAPTGFTFDRGGLWEPVAGS